MDIDVAQNYLVQVYVNGLDGKQNPVYIYVIGAATRYDLLSIEILATRKKFEKKLPFERLLSLLRAPNLDVEGDLENIERQLLRFIKDGRHFQTLVKNRNIKAAERAVNRFCIDFLELNAVTFIELREPSDAELLAVLDRKEKPPLDLDDLPDPIVPAEQGEMVEEEDENLPASFADEGEVHSGVRGEPKETAQDVFIRCDPVLDPVRGVPVSDLHVGDIISVSLPSASVFYRLFVTQNPDFNGLIQAEVTGMLPLDSGSFLVTLDVAQGISGVVTLLPRMRIKVLERASGAKQEKKAEFGFPGKVNKGDIFFMLGGAGVLLFLLWLIYVIVHSTP